MPATAKEALQEIIDDLKKLAALECFETGLSTNKGWITASKTRIKRDAPEHTPVDGRMPETAKTNAIKKLRALAVVIKHDRVEAEAEHGLREPDRRSWEAKRQAVLGEQGVSPIEIAYVYGYASEKAVKELRIRHAKHPSTGFPLTDSERPIVSDRKRARR